MAVRREVLIIVALLVLIALLVKLIEFFKVEVVEGDARDFVLEDLREKYPDAEIEILSITPQYNQYEDRYFEVKARVTEYPDTPCPERSHIFYNYPVQNFIPQLPDVITSGCAVCTEGICVIAFEEEAIIASHTLPNTSSVESYLRYYQNAVPGVNEGGDSWTVTWDSEDATYYYVVAMHRNGTVTSVERLEKA